MAFDPEHESRSRRIIGDGFSVGRLHITGEDIWGWLTIIPVLFLYLVIAITPFAFAVWASLHQWPTFSPTGTFVGLQNYVEVWSIDGFWMSMYRGVLFMVGSTILQLFVGVWMALVVNKLVGLRSRILSTFVFTSYLIPTIIVSLIFLQMLHEDYGILHTAGTSLGLWDGWIFGRGGGGGIAMIAVILISSWKFTAFVTLFTLAQLQSIPSRFYEAAKICGATTWEMFRDITLPRIYGALLVVVFLRAIFMFNKFDIIYQLTQGGPGVATKTMPILAYQETFTGLGKYGMGNTIAIVMFIFLLVAGLIYLSVLNPSQEVKT